MCSSIITNFIIWFVHCSLPGMAKLPKYSIDWAYDHTFSSRKMRLKTSSAKWRPFNYLLQCVNGISIEHTRVKGGYINTQFKDASNDVLEKCVHFHDLSNHAFEIRRWRSWRCKKVTVYNMTKVIYSDRLIKCHDDLWRLWWYVPYMYDIEDFLQH